MRLFANANYKYIENRKKAYVVSAVVILIGVAAMIYNVATIGSWQKYGVDFTGGSLIQVRFSHPVSESDVRAALGESNQMEITPFEGADEYGIRTPLPADGDIDALRTSIQTQLATAFGADAFEIRNTELVGAKAGAELQQKALLAILFSFVLTMIYLAFRFETRFGLAAVIATAHDIVICLAIMAVFRIEVSLPVVASILTVVGYSLNDTIVVFDRIREEFAKRGNKKADQIQLINLAINETLPRTVLTGSTTLLTLLALLLLGPVVIRDFSLILLMGIVIGTYSSIFVASPALIEIRKRFGEGTDREKRPKPQPATV